MWFVFSNINIKLYEPENKQRALIYVGVNMWKLKAFLNTKPD